MHIFYLINIIYLIIYCWCLVRGVDILKRPARAGERPWDCLKGTSVVCVPVHYVLAYINSLEYRGEWDELFLKGIFSKGLILWDALTGVWRSSVLFVIQPRCPHLTEISYLQVYFKDLFMYESSNWAGSVNRMNFVVCSCHSRPQSPRSLWPVAGIESSGLVQHQKPMIHGLPIKFGKSEQLRIWNEYSAHTQKIRLSQSYPYHRPEGSWALGTRMCSCVKFWPKSTGMKLR